MEEIWITDGAAYLTVKPSWLQNGQLQQQMIAVRVYVKIHVCASQLYQMLFLGGFICRKHSEQMGFLQQADEFRLPG